MKRKLLTCFMCAMIVLSGCGKEVADEEEKYLGQNIEDHVIFPDSIEGFVGDTMPFYDDGKFNIFYLADQRAGTQGYHPWALIQTEDFTGYDDKGIVIPYGEDIKDQDIALGTGSVIKDLDGTYHAFYTGHNDTYSPKEAVMHAISKDMISWTKVPEDTFTGATNYSTDDFRDPYVLYIPEESCYWMLVATRYDGDGVIAKYKSTDLSTWTDEGVFFTEDMGSGTNLECPTLIHFGEKWYLAFSDQWPNREVHYRVANSLYDDFIKPEKDIFDGNGFYAGRLETDGKRLFVIGWNPTKDDHLDESEYNWAGNMVTHELKADENGFLTPMVNENVSAMFSNEIVLEPLKQTETVESSDNQYRFCKNPYEVVEFKELLGSYMLKAELSNISSSEAYGLTFDINAENVGNINIVFRPSENIIQFYNTDDLIAGTPQSEISYDFKNDSMSMTAFISDGLVCVYVDDEIAFTTRMYLSQGMKWGIFGINSDVSWDSLTLYK